MATFAVNYVGHPFNASITENKPFYYALLSAGVFFWVVSAFPFAGATLACVLRCRLEIEVSPGTSNEIKMDTIFTIFY